MNQPDFKTKITRLETFCSQLVDNEQRPKVLQHLRDNLELTEEQILECQFVPFDYINQIPALDVPIGSILLAHLSRDGMVGLGLVKEVNGKKSEVVFEILWMNAGKTNDILPRKWPDECFSSDTSSELRESHGLLIPPSCTISPSFPSETIIGTFGEYIAAYQKELSSNALNELDNLDFSGLK